MYHVWQYPVFVLHDLAAMTCMTVVLAAVRGFEERKRAVSVGVFIAAFCVSALNIALLPTWVARTDFDTGFTIYGGIALLPIIIFPQIILHSSRHFSSALICFALNVGAEGLFSVFGYVFDDLDGWAYHFYETVFCLAVYTIVILFFVYTTKNKDLKIIRSTVDLIPKWLYAVIIVCSFSSFFSVMGGNSPELYSFEKMTAVLRALSVFGVILFSGYFVFKVFSLMAKQNRILLQMSMQQTNYEQLLKNDEQLRRFRHDYKNHMLVVTSLLNAGLMNEAKEYLKTIKISSGMSEKKFLTGNFVVDAILNNKCALAEELKVDLQFHGVVPESGIENADLCTVVGNLIDNAIDGAARYPGERYVKVGAAVRNGFLSISVINPVSQRVPIKNNRIKTTKSDAGNHGIGLKNVAAALKKYHGTLSLSCDDRQFTADAALRLRHDLKNS
ncbi:MAG: GHKL domain-containing protein [Clostridia bacterium]|nr:GHKL domain-containing protein [Clostridia bacterium]